LRREDGEMAGLVEDVAGIKKAGFVDDERAAVDSQTGEERGTGDRALVDVEAMSRRKSMMRAAFASCTRVYCNVGLCRL
jgi:hypothetical protein